MDSALKIVEKLEHRAGKDAEGKTGDGVGILLQISHQFFQKAATECGIQLGEARDYGVGMFFFPQDTLRRNQAKKMFEVIVAKEGMEFLGWRKVPVCPEVLGQKALSKMPNIQQAFVKRPGDAARGLEFDRRLYVARRVFEQSNDNTYVPSLSSRTVVYKGMFLVGQLRAFYPDANLTLRVAYGHVGGYEYADGEYHKPQTTLDGIIAKDNPEIYDYDIPQALRELYATKDYGRWATTIDGRRTVPVCFLATNHTTGGNSGSPIINGRGELVGLNFDRTWRSTMSDIEFDPEICRNIAVDIRYVLFVIDRIGGAGYLFGEMDFSRRK